MSYSQRPWEVPLNQRQESVWRAPQVNTDLNSVLATNQSQPNRVQQLDLRSPSFEELYNNVPQSNFGKIQANEDKGSASELWSGIRQINPEINDELSSWAKNFIVHNNGQTPTVMDVIKRGGLSLGLAAAWLENYKNGGGRVGGQKTFNIPGTDGNVQGVLGVGHEIENGWDARFDVNYPI